MDLTTQISLNVIISLAGGLMAVIGAYVKVKSKLDQQSIYIASIERDIEHLRDDKRSIRAELNDLQKEVHTGHQSLETKMAEMELRIVREIQKIGK
jgi:uncharacterized protein YlxW (UPF0749 family)